MNSAMTGTHTPGPCLTALSSQVGKHLLEAFADRDEVVGDDNLRPQSHLSADAKLYLGQGRDAGQAAALLRDVRSWFEGRGVGRALGLPWGDPALALGFAPVAELDRGCPSLAGLETEEEVLLRVGCFPRVLGLEPG